MNRLTKLSEITGLPMPIELIESCGESACRDICDDYVENGCIDCPVQKCMSKLNEYQDIGIEPEQIKSFLKDFGVSVVIRNTKLRKQSNEI